MRLAENNINLPGVAEIPFAVAEVRRRAAWLADSPVDHVALCVEAANLDRYVAELRQRLPGARVNDYLVGEPASGMRIAEVHDRAAAIHVALAAPTGAAGQLVDFLSRTGAEGLQHIAFAVPDVRTAVATLANEGVRFVGGAEIPERGIVEIREGDNWLRQAFSEPLFDEFFLEVIERRGIVEMRPANIRTLYDMNERDGQRTAEPA